MPTSTPLPESIPYLADHAAVRSDVAACLDAASRHAERAAELHSVLAIDELDPDDRAAAWRKMREASWGDYRYHALAADAVIDRALAVCRAFIAYNAYAELGDFTPGAERFQASAVALCEDMPCIEAGIVPAGVDGSKRLEASLVVRDGTLAAITPVYEVVSNLGMIVDALVVGELGRVHSLADVECACLELARAEVSMASSVVDALAAATSASAQLRVLERSERPFEFGTLYDSRRCIRSVRALA